MSHCNLPANTPPSPIATNRVVFIAILFQYFDQPELPQPLRTTLKIHMLILAFFSRYNINMHYYLFRQQESSAPTRVRLRILQRKDCRPECDYRNRQNSILWFYKKFVNQILVKPISKIIKNIPLPIEPFKPPYG